MKESMKVERITNVWAVQKFYSIHDMPPLCLAGLCSFF